MRIFSRSPAPLLACLVLAVARLASADKGTTDVDSKAPVEFEEEDGIVVLTGKNFKQALDHFENLFVEFYAPWCSLCTAFAPDYVEVAKKLKTEGHNVTCAKIDTPSEQELIKEYEIEGFPTLNIFRKGRRTDSYKGYRNVDAVVEWIVRKIGAPAILLETSDAAKTFKDDGEVVVVGYFKELESNETSIFKDIADQIDDYKYGIVHEESIAKDLGFNKPGIKLFKKFDEGEVEYDQDLTSVNDIKQFIQANSMPLVVTFDQRNAQKIFGGDIKSHSLLFLSKSDPKTKDILEEFQKSAKEFKSKVVFVVIDSDQDEHERIIDYFGLKKDELPGLRFIKLQEEMTKYKYPHSELVADKIIEFVNGVLDGKVKPHLMTQELPEDWDKQPVKVLVGTNFDEVAFDKKKDVLVKFYAPWCGHCKALAPIWDQLGEKYKDHEHLIVTKMDAASNELEHTKINSYPTIKLYKRETNEAIEYNGERTLEGLSKFYESGAEYGRAAPDDVTDELDEPEADEDAKQADKHDEL